MDNVNTPEVEKTKPVVKTKPKRKPKAKAKPAKKAARKPKSRKPKRKRKASKASKLKNAARGRFHDRNGKADDKVPFHIKMPRRMRSAVNIAAKKSASAGGNASLWARMIVEKALIGLKLL